MVESKHEIRNGGIFRHTLLQGFSLSFSLQGTLLSCVFIFILRIPNKLMLMNNSMKIECQLLTQR